MADVVYSQLESMLPWLEKLESYEIFTHAEIKAIIKKRQRFEYSTKGPAASKEDFLRYIQYEMNLNILQKKRKKKHGILRLPNKIEHHFQFCISNIFSRMLARFGSDVTLWQQYISYLKKSKNAFLLNQVFARAIQLHPTKESLWIEAAAYEFENNENIVAARSLMERALRLNPKNEHLWVEFCKLEYIYLACIKQRMAEFGVDGSALVPKGESIDTSSLPDAKNTSGAAGDAEGDPSVTKEAPAVKNPFLEGAIPRFIFRNAVQAIPDSPSFRLSFLPVFDAFEDTEAIKQELFEGLLRDFKGDVHCVSLYACHKLHADISPEERPAAVLFALQTYEEALKSTPSAALFEEYLDFCLKCLKLPADHTTVTAAQRREAQAWANRVLEVCHKAEEAALTTDFIYSTWVNTLLNLGRVDDAAKAAEAATDRHAQSASLWLLRIRLHHRRSAVTPAKALLDAQTKQLFAAALDAVPTADSVSLWSHYLELVLSSAELSLDTKLQYFRKALVRLADADKTGVSVMKEAFITRVAATHDLRDARKAYEVGLDVPVATETYFNQCILIERSQRPMDLTVLRSLYRRGTRAHGKRSAKLWLGWIELEVDAGDFSAAANLFWEAKKVVKGDVNKLTAGYQLLKK